MLPRGVLDEVTGMADIVAEATGCAAARAEDDEECGEEKESADLLDVGHGGTLGWGNEMAYGV